jgi:ABC-2 type transport system ATP-binding protein
LLSHYQLCLGHCPRFLIFIEKLKKHMENKETERIEKTPILDVIHISKSFRLGFFLKKVKVLEDVFFQVFPGEIVGFLGPNGAGKTTTIRIINGIIFPDGGSIRIFDQEYSKISVKKRIGFLPEDPYFYHYLTGREFLNFYCQLFGYTSSQRRKRIHELLKLVGMESKADLQMRKYSRGMLQRLGMAQALINEPELVILDEPMTNLDPIGRRQMRDIILQLKNEGKTIFFSTHILSDVEMICDRVVIIMQGKIVSQGKISDLIKEKIDFYEIAFSGIPPQKIARLGECISARDDKLLIKIAGYQKMLKAMQFIENNNGIILSVNPQKMSLEDVFIKKLQQENER